MKIKTQDLTGAALDWAVAKCEGWDAPIFRNRTWAVPLYVATNGTGLHTYAPSTGWAQGGPIIDSMVREGLRLTGFPSRVSTHLPLGRE